MTLHDPLKRCPTPRAPSATALRRPPARLPAPAPTGCGGFALRLTPCLSPRRGSCLLRGALRGLGPADYRDGIHHRASSGAPRTARGGSGTLHPSKRDPSRPGPGVAACAALEGSGGAPERAAPAHRTLRREAADACGGRSRPDVPGPGGSGGRRIVEGPSGRRGASRFPGAVTQRNERRASAAPAPVQPRPWPSRSIGRGLPRRGTQPLPDGPGSVAPERTGPRGMRPAAPGSDRPRAD